MSPDRATLNFLNAFSEDYRKEGERLQREGKVTQIFGDHRKIQGRVEEGGDLCRTTLRFEGEDGWSGECSCKEKRKCPSLVATMTERLERDGKLPESPNEFGDQTLTELLEEKLNRELGPKEDAFVDKLEKRYARFETEAEIKDKDLVRLNPRWPVESYDAIQLWPVPPSNIVEFWNYIAYHFKNRNLGYPIFMDAVTDLEAVEERLREWEEEQAEEAWKQTVYGYDEPELQRVEELELRLMLTTSEARLQLRAEGSEDRFQLVKERENLDELIAKHAQGRLRLDGASALIWESFVGALGETEGVTVRLDTPERARVMNQLFHTPELAGRIVNLDDQVIELSDEAMRNNHVWTWQR
ncbi:MAG: ATP-dependent helicase, partial [Verrucomicrobiota bacterium]